MKKYFVFLLFVFSSCYLAGVSVCLAEEEVEYKTAQECFSAAMKIEIPVSVAGKERGMLWGKKFGLLKRAINLDPKFTNSYIPYVKTFFEQPMVHEFDHAEEIEEMINLLELGLRYAPENGDEFYFQLAKLEYKLRGGGDVESIQKSINYLEQALALYPNSPIRKDLLLSTYMYYQYLGKPDDGVRYLKLIVETKDSGKKDRMALYDLILYFHQVDGYTDLLRYSDLYLDKFGYEAPESLYALYCNVLSCNKLNLHDKLIEMSQHYFSDIFRNHRHASTDRKVYRFLSEAYAAKKNTAMSKKYEKLSNSNE